jgi:hypothetical protein
MEVIIHFLNGNDISMQNHFTQKGYRDDIVVEIAGLYYEVYFYVDGNMVYEMRYDFFSFPGLIVLDDITNEKIFSSINQLIDLNYFDYFKGKDVLPLNKRFQDAWYSYKLDQREASETYRYKLR